MNVYGHRVERLGVRRWNALHGMNRLRKKIRCALRRYGSRGAMAEWLRRGLQIRSFVQQRVDFAQLRSQVPHLFTQKQFNMMHAGGNAPGRSIACGQEQDQ